MPRHIPIWVSVPIVLGLASALYAFDSKSSDKLVQPQGKVWTANDCLGCHTNQATLKLMQDKRGDSLYCQAAYDAMKRSGSKASESPSAKWAQTQK